MAPTDEKTIRINRAPVLTLWAAIVAERLGHPPDTALSLGSHVAGTAARAKARRLGLDEVSAREEPRAASVAEERQRLLGREIAVTRDDGGMLMADAGDGRPVPAEPARAYLARAFGPRLAEARGAMEALAAGFSPEELNRIGFRLYEAFRPEVPPDIKGWGAKGSLDLQKIRSAGEQTP
ncbi:hypothetical protein J8J14_04840 [Roseomonas sp. SSH11]|uniref:Uncharacterized protein n=1 Tax=Pararoseomonas baculiformis TaxID=2820812 RepID=A0ABS4AC70_9PROT|nr:hypothetical protein [Pararoseomonas baculiformis]MBP0444098.1 hypothetical protein [Pararoseomonas baculiformis]